jgi:hypothetical protein
MTRAMHRVAGEEEEEEAVRGAAGASRSAVEGQVAGRTSEAVGEHHGAAAETFEAAEAPFIGHSTNRSSSNALKTVEEIPCGEVDTTAVEEDEEGAEVLFAGVAATIELVAVAQ